VSALLQFRVDQKLSQEDLAERLGVSPGLISHYETGARPVPAERVRDIVVATGGVVTPHDLRPDLYPEGFEFPPEMLMEQNEGQGRLFQEAD